MTNSQKNPRKLPWFVACIAILAAGIVGFNVLVAMRPQPEQREQAELIPQVDVSPLAHRAEPLLVRGNGIVIPKSGVTISPQVSGEIISISPKLVTGGTFKAGETLAQIDARTYQANLDEALANQKANESSLTFINKQITRLESLFDQGFTGEESLDDAINRRDQTLAAIARQKAVIESRQIDLERTRITAPFDGRIYSENIDLGDIVSPGMEIAQFNASDEVEIVVSLNADDSIFIPNLWSQTNDNPPQNAWITVNHGGRNYQWQGYVHRVESDIDRTTRTVDVVVRIPSPFNPGKLLSKSESPLAIESPPLLVGMYANVDIEGISVDKHFVLPITALRPDNTIWTVEGEGMLAIEPVEFIRQEGNLVVLLADLPEGTPIITSNIALVSDGMRVRINRNTLGAAN